jgi:hypothetical protein
MLSGFEGNLEVKRAHRTGRKEVSDDFRIFVLESNMGLK